MEALVQSNIFHLITELLNSQHIEEGVESVSRFCFVGQTGTANSPFHTAGPGAGITKDIFLGEAVGILGKLWCGERSDDQFQFTSMVI